MVINNEVLLAIKNKNPHLQEALQRPRPRPRRKVPCKACDGVRQRQGRRPARPSPALRLVPGWELIGPRVVVGFIETGENQGGKPWQNHGKTRGKPGENPKSNGEKIVFSSTEELIRACYNVGASSAIFRHSHI